MSTTSALLWVVLALGTGSAGVPEPAGPGPARPTGLAPSEARAGGKVFLSQDEALELAFPKCEVKRATFALSEDELKRANELAGKDVEVDRRVVIAYAGYDADGKLVGTAYFDKHRVRTLDEVLMFVVDGDARIRRLEMLSFGEPEEYIPRGKWYAQFVGKKLDDGLRLKGDIKGVTGATLTATATTAAARRTLALHAVIAEREKPAGAR